MEMRCNRSSSVFSLLFVVVFLSGLSNAAPKSLSVNPNSISFAPAYIGDTRTSTVTISNTGKTAAKVTGIAVSGAGFSAGGMNLPMTINTGASVSFWASFSPTSPGNASGTITITSNSVDSPALVQLSGSTLSPPQITSISLPNGQVGAAYQTAMSASGGITPYHWSVAAGSALPGGLTLDALSGIISGTPSQAGAWNVSIQLSDSSSPPRGDSRAFAMNVASTAPTITQVNPNSGTALGGTGITISGSNFLSGATVSVGGTAATSVQVVSSTQITATTPAGAAGPAAVTVTNPDNQSASAANAYTYIGAPSISSVSPTGGAIAGGTTVTLSGANFVNGAVVTFGGVAATSIVVNNSAQITAATPAHAAGTVDIQVTNPDAQSGQLAQAFTYSGAPSVTTIFPASAVSTGGQVIVISGSNLKGGPGAQVLFGNVAATNIIANGSSTQLQVTVPAHPVGPVDITVTNSDGQTTTIVNGFRFGQILFQNGFESADFTGWDYATTNPDPTNPRLTIQNNPAFLASGSYSAQFHYAICGDSTNPACGAAHQDSNVIVEKDFNTTANPPGLYHLFVRGRVFIQSPQNGGTMNIQRKFFFLKDPPGPNGTPNQNWAWFLTSDGSNNQMYLRLSFQSTISPAFTLNGADNELGDPGIQSGVAALAYDTWYTIEMEMQRKSGPGLADCIIRVWINGILKFQKTTNWTRTQYEQPFPDDSLATGITRIEVGNQADRQNYAVVDELRFWDDIVIADAYIGP